MQLSSSIISNYFNQARAFCSCPSQNCRLHVITKTNSTTCKANTVMLLGTLPYEGCCWLSFCIQPCSAICWLTTELVWEPFDATAYTNIPHPEEHTNFIPFWSWRLFCILGLHLTTT